MYTKKIIDGYYEKSVMYDKRLQRCPYGSCGIVQIDPNIIAMISYTTKVIEFNTKTGWVICTGTYSATTRKHIGAFCKEYLPASCGYYQMKHIAEKGLAYNVFTGELMDIAKAVKTLAI